MILQELTVPSAGGQERRSLGLGQALASLGLDVELLVIGHADGLAQTERIGGVLVRRGPFDPNYVRPSGGRRWQTVVRYAWQARQAVRSNLPDLVIYLQWPVLHTVLRPRSVASRTVVDWCETRSSPVHRLVQATVPRLGAFNTAVSRDVAAAVGKQSKRCVNFLPTGLDDALPFAPDAPNSPGDDIVYVGRIAAHKRVPMLIEAFALARAEGFAGRLHIAGDGPAMADVRDAAHRASAGGVTGIVVHGSVSEGVKLDLLRSARWFAMPSEREGFPLSVVEAMAMGVPTVTTAAADNGTCAVVQEYGSGVVVESTPMALAAAFLDMSGWSKLSEQGRAAANAFRWPVIARELLDLTIPTWRNDVP